MIKIASVNVNGIRAAWRKGMDHWLQDTQPDVLCLQEVRADSATAAELLGPNWQLYDAVSAIKGRAGVAVAVHAASNIEVSSHQVGLGSIYGATPEPEVDTGRWLEAVLHSPDRGRDLRVVSAYLHSGVVGTPKLAQKLAHLSLVGTRLEQLQDEYCLVVGDFNVVRGPDDIKNWRANHNKTAGVLDEEIAHLEAWMGPATTASPMSAWVDVLRHLHPQGPGPYTWWSNRGQAFVNDVGWRIDYHMATQALAAAARHWQIDRAPSWEARFSDHAPLVISYDW